jgi:hypothetical protein
MLRLLQDLFWNVVRAITCPMCGCELPVDTVAELRAAERHTRTVEGER